MANANQLAFSRPASAPDVPLGHLFWFTVDHRIRPLRDVIQAITTHGLAPYGLPEGISPSTAARRAAQALPGAAPSKTLIRTLQRTRDTWIQQWIRESVNAQKTGLDFTPLGEIRWTKGTPWQLHTQNFSAMTSAEKDVWDTLPEYWHTAETHLTPGDMRIQVQIWIRSAHPIAMQHAGPVHFVPAEGTSLLDDLLAAQEALGLQCWKIPLPPEPGVEATIIESLQTQVQAESNALIRRIQKAKANGKSLTDTQEQRLLEDFQALRKQAEYYRDCFRTGLERVEDDLDLTRQQIRSALNPE